MDEVGRVLNGMVALLAGLPQWTQVSVVITIAALFAYLKVSADRRKWYRLRHTAQQAGAPPGMTDGARAVLGDGGSLGGSTATGIRPVDSYGVSRSRTSPTRNRGLWRRSRP